MRPVRFAAACLLAAAAALPAQEIFWDGFEFGDICAWSNLPPVYQEQEPFDDSGQNDEADFSNAELIPTRCAVVEGTIGNPYIGPSKFEEQDTDYYELGLEGPLLLRVTLERLGAESHLEPFALILNNSAYELFAELPLGLPIDDPQISTRQVYVPENGFDFLDPPNTGPSKKIPANGRFYVNVDSLWDCGFLNCGGQDERYRLTIQIEPLTGIPTQFSFGAPAALETKPDGADHVFRFDGTLVTKVDSAETSAGEDPVVDLKLYLVEKVGSSLVTLAGMDDQSDTSVDAILENISLSSNPHFLIVDPYAEYDYGPLPFELSLTLTSLPGDDPHQQ